MGLETVVISAEIEFNNVQIDDCDRLNVDHGDKAEKDGAGVDCGWSGCFCLEAS